MFKVVADQLRISDGWVRCGHCKQVFDASANLQAAAQVPMMPEMALDKLRAPTSAVRRNEPPERSWGLEAASGPVKDLPAKLPPDAAVPGTGQGLPLAEGDPRMAAQAHAPGAPAASVLQIPESTVPAFLVADAAKSLGALSAESLALVPDPHFGWSPTGGTTLAEALLSHEAGPRRPRSPDKLADAGMIEWPTIDVGPAAATGYELPSPIEAPPDAAIPELPESGDSLLPLSGLSDAACANVPMGGPATSVPVDGTPRHEAVTPRDMPSEKGAVALPQGTTSLAANTGHSERSRIVESDDETAPGALAGAEPSFVRAARRKAFWRKPVVRMVLSVVVFAMLASLGLQMALHERNYLVARVPQMRVHLERLCGHLQCSLGPYRQIAAVEVDSSSFQKVRGDSYQFSLALKNRSDLAVEMPAVELTLTDAQDQPVLRRVIQPTEWAAPPELLARGEWSVSRSLQIAPGIARITGYRVMAFYP